MTHVTQTKFWCILHQVKTNMWEQFDSWLVNWDPPHLRISIPIHFEAIFCILLWIRHCWCDHCDDLSFLSKCPNDPAFWPPCCMWIHPPGIERSPPLPRAKWTSLSRSSSHDDPRVSTLSSLRAGRGWGQRWKTKVLAEVQGMNVSTPVGCDRWSTAQRSCRWRLLLWRKPGTCEPSEKKQESLMIHSASPISCRYYFHLKYCHFWFLSGDGRQKKSGPSGSLKMLIQHKAFFIIE